MSFYPERITAIPLEHFYLLRLYLLVCSMLQNYTLQISSNPNRNLSTHSSSALTRSSAILSKSCTCYSTKIQAAWLLLWDLTISHYSLLFITPSRRKCWQVPLSESCFLKREKNPLSAWGKAVRYSSLN